MFFVFKSTLAKIFNFYVLQFNQIECFTWYKSVLLFNSKKINNKMCTYTHTYTREYNSGLTAVSMNLKWQGNDVNTFSR